MTGENGSLASLKWSSFTEGMENDDIRILAEFFQTMRYSAGDRIFSAGTAGIGMGILIEGSASVMVNESGKQKRIAVISQGETFGELSLLDDEPRSANVVADGPIKAVLMNRMGLERMLESEPEVAAKFLLRVGRILARRIRLADSKISHFA